jgi:hypothetical protein
MGPLDRPNETVKVRKDDPQQYASCYTMDLYCDHTNPAHPWDSFPHSFMGETFGECAKQARKRGWVLHKDRTATCPICNKRNEK